MKAVAVVIVAIGGGLALWAIGSRISVDVAAMGVGLLFGAMAGVPCGWLLVAAGGQHGDYATGYAAGRNDAHLEMLEVDARRLVARQSAELQAQRQPTIVGQPQYTVAHPFAALTTSLDHLPALVGEVVDEADLDWDDPAMLARYAPSGRQFRIVGEIAPYNPNEVAR